ncbi:uncharacterized protein ARMOST_14784 [Armillaria ostoyae]|uniref:Uncharacterized protein n=1 Tax=Armillaria ostoyae TaxID=47428 RepID=A0A284RRI0_ARMOS|nr:uncharacterized protein ARMOST_14784 [Armillaria ostoyae]
MFADFVAYLHRSFHSLLVQQDSVFATHPPAPLLVIAVWRHAFSFLLTFVAITLGSALNQNTSDERFIQQAGDSDTRKREDGYSTLSDSGKQHPLQPRLLFPKVSM